MNQQSAENRGLRKERIGFVVSDKMDKSIVVRVNRRTAHELYKKTITKSKKYHAHDAENTARVGDQVRIIETRPLSKTKRWRLVEVMRRAEQD